MLSSEIKMCGEVTTRPAERKTKNGDKFINFTLSLSLKDEKKQMVKRPISVCVYDDLDAAAQLKTGDRVYVEGTLNYRKRAGAEYLYVNTRKVSKEQATIGDILTGTAVIEATIGRDVEERKDKNDKPYIVFSGFQSEKVDDNREFLWIRFIGFGMNKEPWMEKKNRFKANVSVDISLYHGSYSPSCTITKIEPITSKQQTNNE